MRFPQVPPSFDELLRTTAAAGRLEQVLGLADRLQADASYRHWDELRRRPVRRGYSVEEAWLALKLKRKAAYRDVPLRDRNGKAFRFFVPTALLDLLHAIDVGAGGKIGTEGPVLDAQMRDRYIVSSLMHEAITSSQLEGAVATRAVAKEMIRSGRPPRDRSEVMILNNYRTMQAIIELRDRPMSLALLLDLHRCVTADTLDDADAAGRFRAPDEAVRVLDGEGQVLHDPPPAEELEARAARMCAFANAETPDYFMHPVVRSIVLHFWLAYDHPFADGNGRTARALFYWSMLHRGYWLFEFVSISGILLQAPAQYARAFLHTETDENDLNYFILHQAQVIRRAVQALHAYIERKQAETREAGRRLRYLRGLTHRQQALIAHALRHPAQEYTIESHRRSHAVAYATARSDLLALVRYGLLSQRRRGRALVFEPAPDLNARLDALAREKGVKT